MGRGVHEVDLRVAADGTDDEVDAAEVVAELLLDVVVDGDDLVAEGGEVGLGLGVINDCLHRERVFRRWARRETSEEDSSRGDTVLG